MFKLNKAQIGGRGAKLPEGRFKVKLRAIKAKESKNVRAKTKDDPISIVEFKVIEIANQKAVEHQHGKQNISIQPTEVGASRSWAMNMTKEASPGNLLGFCVAVSGIDPSDAKGIREAWDEDNGGPVDWDKFYEFAAGEDNPFGGEDGLEMWVEVKPVITEDGFCFLVHDWAPVEGANVLFPAKSTEKAA